MKKAHIKQTDGRLIELEHDSEILKDNPLKDPSLRRFQVWLPPDYDAKPNQAFPVLFNLPPYTASGGSYTGWQSFSESMPERLNRLWYERQMGSAIVVFPDSFTAYGGNQFVNSSAVGDYADYLIKELIPFIDQELKTLRKREHRACFGYSSGGYGAMIHGMKYAKHWGAIAMQSGDCAFDQTFQHLWQQTATFLTRYQKPEKLPGRVRTINPCVTDDGRIKRFLKETWQKAVPNGDEITALMCLGQAAFYDPNPDAPNGFNLPIDLITGELVSARWTQWRKHDPIYLVKRYANNLKTLKALFIDCGWRDQYHLHFGARQLVQQLQTHAVPHHYEEHDGTHSSNQHRFDVSLPILYKAIR